jgi:hypothetical protein
MTSPLPPDILVIVDWLAERARGYRLPHAGPNDPGRLQWREAHGFKSELMLRTARWSRERVPVAAFRQACLDANLSLEDTATLVGFLQQRQAGKQLRPHRARKGWTYDRVIAAAGYPDDDDAPSDLGEPSEDW